MRCFIHSPSRTHPDGERVCLTILFLACCFFVASPPFGRLTVRTRSTRTHSPVFLLVARLLSGDHSLRPIRTAAHPIVMPISIFVNRPKCFISLHTVIRAASASHVIFLRTCDEARRWTRIANKTVRRSDSSCYLGNHFHVVWHDWAVWTANANVFNGNDTHVVLLKFGEISGKKTIKNSGGETYNRHLNLKTRYGPSVRVPVFVDVWNKQRSAFVPMLSRPSQNRNNAKQRGKTTIWMGIAVKNESAMLLNGVRDERIKKIQQETRPRMANQTK